MTSQFDRDVDDLKCRWRTLNDTLEREEYFRRKHVFDQIERNMQRDNARGENCLIAIFIAAAILQWLLS